jgi:hypothetical protein
MKIHFIWSICIHVALLIIASRTSALVYEEAEYEKKVAAAQDHIAAFRQAQMRKMVDEMEVILEIMKRIEEAPSGEPTGAEPAEQSEPSAEAPEEFHADEPESDPDEAALDEPVADEIEAEESDADIPDPEGDGAEDIIEKATEVDAEIEQSYREILAEHGIAPPGPGEPSAGTAAGDGSEGVESGGVRGSIADKSATARRRLHEVLALQNGRERGTSLYGEGNYWEDFALDRLGGRSPDEFTAGPDESDLARNRNRRSARFDNRRLRSEINAARLQPARSFRAGGDQAKWTYVDSWYTIGPFPNPERSEHATSFPPETIVDLDAIYLGRDDKPVEWRYLQSDSPRVAPPTMDEYTVHYAYTELRSDAKRRLWIAFGSDDSLTAWLNGQRVWVSAVHLKEWNIADGFVEVDLQPGYNTLLLRLENAWGPGFFSASMRLGE